MFWLSFRLPGWLWPSDFNILDDNNNTWTYTVTTTKPQADSHTDAEPVPGTTEESAEDNRLREKEISDDNEEMRRINGHT